MKPFGVSELSIYNLDTAPLGEENKNVVRERNREVFRQRGRL